MRRALVGVVVSAVVMLSACGEQAAPSLAPQTTAPRLQSDIVAGPACPNQANINLQIVALFGLGYRIPVVLAFDHIEDLLEAGDTATARSKTLALVGFTLATYQKGKLNGGFSSATQQAVVTLVNSFFCFVGLPQSLTLAALGPDGAAAVLTPTSPDTAVVTGTKFAGVKVDSGTVTQTVLVTITRLPDSPGPLLTQLDQYPLFYEVHVTPAGSSLALPVVVGTCQAASIVPPDPSRLRIAHNVAPFTPGSIEILPLAPAPFLDCTNANVTGLRSANPLANLAYAGWRAVRPLVQSLFMPDRLMASASGVGGTVRNFSPFGAVDTLAVMTPNSPTSQRVPVSGTVPAPPSVAVHTPTGRAISGLPVNFAVTAGGGALTAASTATDTTGVATVGSWTLGPAAGLNTVSATATPPEVGSGVGGSPLTFSATALAPSQLVFQTQPSNVVAASPMAPAVQVAVEDQDGQVVTTATGTVSLALTGSPAGVTLAGGGAATLTNGVATFGSLSVNKAGTYTLTPSTSVSGVTTLPASGSFTVSPGTPTQLVWTQQPGNITAGATMTPAVTVTVEDAQGNTVTSSGASVSLALSPSGTLGGTTTVSAVGGVATFSNLTVTKAGTGYALVASSAPLASATSSTFSATGGAAAAIVAVAGNGQTTTEGSKVTIPPSVRVTDAYGNPVSGVLVTFAVVGRSGSVTGAIQTTGATGTATVGSWTIIEETNHLTATAGASGVAGNPVTFTAYGTEPKKY